LPDFTYENWDSSMRTIAGFPPCGEGRSDFFYLDENERLSKLFNLEPSTQIPRLFLLEVKSSFGSFNVFHMSQRQFSQVTR
jgi:hypothetical protein